MKNIYYSPHFYILRCYFSCNCVKTNEQYQYQLGKIYFTLDKHRFKTSGEAVFFFKESAVELSNSFIIMVIDHRTYSEGSVAYFTELMYI